MSLRHQFTALLIFITLGYYAQAQEPASGSSTQKILQAEKAMSSATKDRIAAVRSADSVWCGFLDKDGVQWFGTNEGVYRYDGKTFTNYSVKDGLHNNQVFSIVEDKDGNLWFGTADGLSRHDRKTFTYVPIPWNEITGPWLDKVYPVVNPNQVMSMAIDKDGIIWIGTNGAGAYRFDGETFTSFLADKGSVHEGGLHHNIIYSVLVDASGDIWFGSITHAGITRYDGKTFSNFSLKDGLSDDMIRSIFQDSTGKLWFGTHGKHGTPGKRNGGLDFYDGKSFTKITNDDGLLRGHVIAIYEDKSGSIWIGRGVGTMCNYDGTTLAPFVTKEGQSFNGIHFISEDATGNMWFGGRKGKLFRYDGETVTDFSREGL
jgi:ligand-binding sensor domain-containing protein